MTFIHALGLASLLLIGAAGTCASAVEPDKGSMAVRCGTLIDGVSGAPRRDVTVVIRDGRIQEVGESLPAPAGLPLLDLPRLTCLPGLIDTHTHLTDRPGDTANLAV